MLTQIETYMLYCANEGEIVSLHAELQQESNTWLVKIERTNGFTIIGDSICLQAAFELMENECKLFLLDPHYYMFGDNE